MTSREKAALAAIFVLAAALRLAGLGSLPLGLHPDEAGSAYEAWCLAQTGRSSDGRAHPLVFLVTENRIEGTYIYLEAPFVAFLGDRIELAARLPAALAGTLAVLATFSLGRRLGEKLGPEPSPRAGVTLGLLAAALLAVEPWAVHHSRLALSPPLLPVLVAWGIALALEGLDREERSRGLACSLAGGAVLAIAATCVYTPARAFIPALALALVLAVPGSRERKLAVFAPIALGLALIAPFAFSQEGAQHAREVLVGPAQAFKNYWKYFAPRALLLGEIDQGFYARGVPPLLAFEFVLVGLGIATCLSRRERHERLMGGPAVLRRVIEWMSGIATVPRHGWFLLAWLALFPAAAAWGEHSPNMLRAIFGLPLFALLGAIGLSRLLDALEKKPARARAAVLAVSLVILAFSLGHAAYRYVLVFPDSKNAWKPYRGERERVEAMRGTVELELPFERPLVDLHARERPHTWLDARRVRFD